MVLLLFIGEVVPMLVLNLVGSLWLAGSLTSNSDSRIKTNIKNIDDDEALKQISSINIKNQREMNYIDKKTTDYQKKNHHKKKGGYIT